MKKLLLAVILALSLKTTGTTQTTKVVPEWKSATHFYYRPQDCPRSHRGPDGWVGCSRVLVQFAAVRIVSSNASESAPDAPAAPQSSFVPRQHPDGPQVVFTIYPAECKPIPGDLRGLWVCKAPKDHPYGIGWRPAQ